MTEDDADLMAADDADRVGADDADRVAGDDAVKDRFEWGVTYLMRDAGAATDLGGNAVVVTDQARNRDVAAEFAKFLVTKENMQTFCEQTTVLPVRKDLADAKLAYASRPDLMPVFQQQATTMPACSMSTQPGAKSRKLKARSTGLASADGVGGSAQA